MTEKWAAQWSDLLRLRDQGFAQPHRVAAARVARLGRDLRVHASPNGNFSFNFFIALKAQPDIKFDYDHADYPARHTRDSRFQ